MFKTEFGLIYGAMKGQGAELRKPRIVYIFGPVSLLAMLYSSRL